MATVSHKPDLSPPLNTMATDDSHQPDSSPPLDMNNHGFFTNHTTSFHNGPPFLQRLRKYYQPSGTVESPMDGVCLFHEGLYNIFDIDVFVQVLSSDWMVFYYRTYEDAVKLHQTLEEREKADKVEPDFPVYEMTKFDGWKNINGKSYQTMGKDRLIGYHEYLDKIQNDISNASTYNVFLSSIGEHHTLNYLLYGPPGVGKTSFVKTLATILHLPIFVIKNESLNEDVDELMNPKLGHPNRNYDPFDMRILLFEDFDRYLNSIKSEDSMADILNAMDGIVSDVKVIRFFTGNNPEVIFNNEALLSRMTDVIEFKYPSIEFYMAKLSKFLTFYPEGQISLCEVEAFKSALCSKLESSPDIHVSLRVFSAFVSRYIFHPNCMNRMINNLEELFKTCKKRQKLEKVKEEIASRNLPVSSRVNVSISQMDDGDEDDENARFRRLLLQSTC
jgi:hypothetical protein